MPSMLTLLPNNLVGSKLPELGILEDLVCDRGQRSPYVSMPAGRAEEDGVLGPCCTLLAGSSMDSWSGSFLETSDSPVLPPYPRGTIPHPSRLHIPLQQCSLLSASWGVGQAHVPSNSPSLLPAAIPPVRLWIPVGGWHLGSRSSLCELGCPQASKGPSNVWSGSAEIQVPTNHSVILLPWAFTMHFPGPWV